MQIFLARNNIQAGPYDLEQLNIMLVSGEVTLDDLVWHEGLDKWQRIGDLTYNQKLYRPTKTVLTNNTSDDDSIINNVTVFPEDTDTNNHSDGKSVSLDRLYGKPERPTTNSNKPKADMTTNRQYAPNNVSLNKSNTVKSATAKDVVIGNVVLAPVITRLLATAIDLLLIVIAFLPLWLAFRELGGMPTEMQSMEQIVAYSMSASEKIPLGTQLLSNVMVFGLIVLQLLFIIIRGQSLGKLITGIRVVDHSTHRLPSFFRSVVLRTIFLVLIYLPFSVTLILPILLAVNYYMASKNPENMGWHDKLAKTLVVKADKEQLVKPSKLN